MSQNDDKVTLVGVRADGTQQVLGEAVMPPKMKAAEIVRTYFGQIDEASGDEGAMALWACNELVDWMAKRGDMGAQQLLPVAPLPEAAAKLRTRLDRLIAYYGLDHQCHGDDEVELDVRDPDEFLRSLLDMSAARSLAGLSEYLRREAQTYINNCDRQPDGVDSRTQASVDRVRQWADAVDRLCGQRLVPGTEIVGWQYKGPATGQQWWHADEAMYEWAKKQDDYETRELCVAKSA